MPQINITHAEASAVRDLPEAEYHRAAGTVGQRHLGEWAMYHLHDASEGGAFKAPKISAADVQRGARLYAPDVGEEA